MVTILARPLDAVIVGTGPNGLAAAIAMAEQGLSTLLVEGAETAGGGMRSQPLTLPGFTHDLCSAVHPLGMASPFFSRLPLERHGLSWIQSPAPVAHVVSEHEVAVLERSIDATAEQLGPDGPAYRDLMRWMTDESEVLIRMFLGPLRPPERPLLMARFGLQALLSLYGLARRFRREAAPALLAGIAAHAMIPLDEPATASFGLMLAMAGHAVGWPIARGGSQAIADALVAHYLSIGGRLELGRPIRAMRDLPAARAYLFDTGPRALVSIAGDLLPTSYARRVDRFRYGPGVFKIDWALSSPIPWRDPRCARAVTVHLSGTLADVDAAEKAVHAGRLGDRPFVLLGQPTIVDPSRAPAGQHVAWAYCHVPHGDPIDARERIEAHVERFAPGFRDCILARSCVNAVEMQAHNPNYVGGDINGGYADLTQLFFRPMVKADPYATPAPNLFLCSSSTPPGGGVHGMCGYWAAKSALRRVFGIRARPL